LKEIGARGQEKLKDSSVLIVGAGGLGCPAIAYLAGAGVGKLGVVDGDILDASNLHRQTNYRSEDLGRPKAELAAEYVQKLNPEVEVAFATSRLTANESLEWFSKYDLVLDCTDNLDSKQLISDVAVLTNTPFVSASVYQFEGQLQTFTAKPGSPCFRCVWPDSQAQQGVLNCAEAGVIGPVPGVLGCLQAMEAIKLLLDLQGQIGDQLLLINLLSYETRTIKLPANYEGDHHLCLEQISLDHYQRLEELELSFENLNSALDSGMLLVDIRNTDGIQAPPLPGAIALQEKPIEWQSDPKHRYLLVCAQGVRSKNMASKLNDENVRAFSLKGGVRGLGL
ncbi:MAG: HesA/MoeB/ThiF family protein, partial [Pseudomonadota bacterium]